MTYGGNCPVSSCNIWVAFDRQLAESIHAEYIEVCSSCLRSSVPGSAFVGLREALKKGSELREPGVLSETLYIMFSLAPLKLF